VIAGWTVARDWHQAGVWQQLHEALLAELNAAGALDWSKAVIDSSHVRAVKGGPKPARARLTVPGRAGRPHRAASLGQPLDPSVTCVTTCPAASYPVAVMAGTRWPTYSTPAGRRTAHSRRPLPGQAAKVDVETCRRPGR